MELMNENSVGLLSPGLRFAEGGSIQLSKRFDRFFTIAEAYICHNSPDRFCLRKTYDYPS